LLTEFAEKIVRPCYSGNINTAIKDLIQKAIAEQEFVLSHTSEATNRNNT